MAGGLPGLQTQAFSGQGKHGAVVARSAKRDRGVSRDVAKKLGYGKRSLQRRLKEEGTSLQKQLNRTRKLLAKTYLADGERLSRDYYAFWPKSRTTPLVEEFAGILKGLFA